MAKRDKSEKRERPRERRERLFEARASVSPAIAYALGAVGAAILGSGAWAQFGATWSGSDLPPLRAAPALLVIGAILVGVAVWIGTSGEPPLRVGDGGVGIDKGETRRIPWYAVERIEWRAEALRVFGKDEAERKIALVVRANHAQAAAWILKEARERVPSVVDVPKDATLPEPRADAGQSVVLDPPQVVGQRCAASGTIITYEPDARICPRCDRVYHKAHVPEVCTCGAALTGLRQSA